MATVEGWLEKGVNRVIIGTAAVRNPALVKEAARKFPKRVAVGLDARDGKVAVEGWAETSELTALDIARRFEDAGVAAIIYTDVARDGMLKGLNLDATIALAEAISIPVIASGGLASIDDIKQLIEPRAKKLEGAIAGRALYDGRLDAGAGAEADPRRAGQVSGHVQGPRHSLPRCEGRPRRQGRQFRQPARRRRSGGSGDCVRRRRRRRADLSRHHRQPREPRDHSRRRAAHRGGLLHAAHRRRRRAHGR